MVVGPWGGGGGRPWKDREDVDGIKEISIVSGHVIISITVIYSKNGELIAGEKHGGNNVGRLTKVLFLFLFLPKLHIKLNICVKKFFENKN